MLSDNNLDTARVPAEALKALCLEAADKKTGRLITLAEQLANMGLSGPFLDFAFDIATGTRQVDKVAEDIYVLDGKSIDTEACDTLVKANHFVSESLNVPHTVLVIDPCLAGAPTHALTGLNGFGVITADKNTLKHFPLMVHEVTHCALMSRLLFLDEGLATFMQNKAQADRETIESLLTPFTSIDRPSLASLIETDWSADPCFEQIVSRRQELNETGPIHLLGAFLVEKMVENTSLAEVASRFSALKSLAREGRAAAVFQELFNLDLWQLDKSITESNANLSTPEEMAETASRILAENEVTLASQHLPSYRLAAMQYPEGALNLAKLLIVMNIKAEFDVSGYVYRSEFYSAIERARVSAVDSELMDFIDAHKPLMKFLGLSGNVIEKRSVGAKVFEALHQLLVRYPNNPEVVIAAAKGQKHSPYPFLDKDVWQHKLAQCAVNKNFGCAVESILSHEYFQSGASA